METFKNTLNLLDCSIYLSILHILIIKRIIVYRYIKVLDVKNIKLINKIRQRLFAHSKLNLNVFVKNIIYEQYLIYLKYLCIIFLIDEMWRVLIINLSIGFIIWNNDDIWHNKFLRSWSWINCNMFIIDFINYGICKW